MNKQAVVDWAGMGNNIKGWWSKLSPMQQKMIIGGGIGAGAGLLLPSKGIAGRLGKAVGLGLLGAGGGALYQNYKDNKTEAAATETLDSYGADVNKRIAENAAAASKHEDALKTKAYGDDSMPDPSGLVDIDENGMAAVDVGGVQRARRIVNASTPPQAPGMAGRMALNNMKDYNNIGSLYNGRTTPMSGMGPNNTTFGPTQTAFNRFAVEQDMDQNPEAYGVPKAVSSIRKRPVTGRAGYISDNFNRSMDEMMQGGR